MRKIIAALAVLAALGVAPTAKADSCHGDLYCDGQPRPDPGCKTGTVIIPCSAGDALVDAIKPH